MSYFNHAYKKTFLAQTVEAVDGVATSLLAAGEVAIVDAADYKSIVINGSTNAPDEFLIVQGNLNDVDTLGGNPLHGGYAESIKSKLIKKNYVTALWKVDGTYASASTSVSLYVSDGAFGATDHPQIRIDLKGSEVLRSLNRNEYFIADATGCGASGDGDLTGLEVVTAWKDAINDDPIMSKFVTATVADVVAADATVGALVPAQLASLVITVDYAATTFHADSFDTRDAYNTDPLTLTVSAIDDEGDACASTAIETAGRVWTDVAAGTDLVQVMLAATGVTDIRLAPTVTGECVLRDLIQDGRYRQDGGFNQGNKDSNRFREIEGGKKIVDAIAVADPYSIYYLQHSVPRFNNPTGVFDNDQYIVAVAVKRYTTATGTVETSQIAAMDNAWDQIAGATGLTVTTPLV
jgi:hypothetical protein